MRLAAWLLAATAFALAGASPAGAAWTRERIVLQQRSGFDDVALAGNERGDAALVYGGGGGIAVALAKPGRNFGRPRYVRWGSTGREPRVAVDEAGNVLVLWKYNDHSEEPDPRDLRDEGCCEHIRLALLRAGRKRFDRPKSVGTPGFDVYLAAFSMINGRIGVSWSEGGGLAARFSRRGLRLGPSMRLTGEVSPLAASPLRTGAVLTFVRVHYRRGGSIDWRIAELRARRGRSPARRTLFTRRGQDPRLSLATNAKGGQLLAWSELGQSELYNVYASYRSRTGRFHPRRMRDEGSFSAPRVALARTGAGIVAWDAEEVQLFAASRKPGGAFDRGRAFGPAPRDGAANVQVAVDAVGRAVLGWRSGGERGAFRTLAGRMVGLRGIGPGGEFGRASAAALDKHGNGRLAWRNGRSVFAARGRFPGR